VGNLALKSKKRALILLSAFLVLSIILYYSPLRWKFIGFIRGEEFYKDMPASYWKERIEADYRIKEMRWWQKISRRIGVENRPFKVSEDDEEAKVLIRAMAMTKT